MSLTPEDREALAATIETRRAGTRSDDLNILTAVEQIVARHVAAALNEAADAIEATGAVCINAHGSRCIGGIAYRDSTQIVRDIVRARISP